MNLSLTLQGVLYFIKHMNASQSVFGDCIVEFSSLKHETAAAYLILCNCTTVTYSPVQLCTQVPALEAAFPLRALEAALLLGGLQPLVAN